MGSKHSKENSGGAKTLTGAWTKQTDGPYSGRFDHTLVLTSNKTLLLFGGVSEGWSQKSDLWEYSIDKKEWKEIQTETKPPGLKDHTAVFYEGSMYVFGGKSGNNFTNSLWRYDTKENKWEELKADDSFPSIRAGHSAVVYDGKMFVYGGDSGKGELDCLWSYNFANRVWKKAETTTNAPGRLYHTANVIDNKMYVTGGFRNKEQLNDFYVLDFSNLTWKKMDDLPFTARSGHLGLESKGRLFIHGGELGTHGNGYQSASDLWVYQIKKNQWTEVKVGDEKPLGRLGHRGVIINHSELYVTGGTRVDGPQWNPVDWFHDLWIGKVVN